MCEGPESVTSLSHMKSREDIVAEAMCAVVKMEKDEVKGGSKGQHCGNNLGFHSKAENHWKVYERPTAA